MRCEPLADAGGHADAELKDGGAVRLPAPRIRERLDGVREVCLSDGSGQATGEWNVPGQLPATPRPPETVSGPPCRSSKGAPSTS